jgi:hypothetical protein
MTRKPCTLVWIFGALSALSLGACSSGSGNGGTGGAGGAAPGTGGSTSGTGGSTTGTGGTGAGGASNTGGATGTAGASGTGGRNGTGGASGTGGRTDGGTNGTGGVTGTGGATGTDGGSTQMNFFVTSIGSPNGGNLGGLAGADAFCKMLANNVSAALGARTWHAYLSTTTVNARDRIGTGPWRNAAGHVIANNLTDLHSQIPAPAPLDATWPIGSTAIALDEHGAAVPSNPLQHDILTGSQPDGTLMTGMNCNNWTSQAMTDVAQVGHSNRMGGGFPAYWNSNHASTGCAPVVTIGSNLAGTVGSGGGRGSLYCFAVD